MARPLIGVTGNARRWSPSWWCIRTALTLVGCAAHRISVLNPDMPRRLDAIIISGGDDIHPSLYSTEDHDDEDADPERDQLEIQCINSAIRRNIPVLGICRGAQLINVVRGGTLYGDITPFRKFTRNPHLYPSKRISINASSSLSGMLNRTTLKVNSLHHQAIRELGDSLEPVAFDADNFIQAIEDTVGRRILGVQWHPEYLLFLPAQLTIFRWLKMNA